jgi:hypothetical protein
MTQFLLAQGVDTSLLPKSIKVVPALHDDFLRAAGEQIFGTEAMPEIVSVVADGEEFDSVFVRARRELNEGKDYEHTELNTLLVSICRAARRVALWYGSDYAGLELVQDLRVLGRIVQEGLQSPSVEVYAMFANE